MSVVQVKKVIAVCLLEAVKLTMEHLGAFRLETAQRGVPGSPEVPRLYGEARRLRDYLQRCAAAYQDIVDLDLADSDRPLLVACCRRLVEQVDLRLTSDVHLAADERPYLTKKRDVLSDWIVELATKPLLELPLSRLSPVQTESARALMARIASKLYGANPKLKIERAQSSALPAAEEPTAEAPQAPAAPVPSADAQLLDPQTLRDPRLRALAVMYLRSYARAIQEEDHRIAAVLLASILEAAILDHALPRRDAMGLPGTPDGWNPADVLAVALVDKLQPLDRSLASQLFGMRNLLRPGLQVMTPSVVTVASLERLREFVQRMLRALGFAGGTSPAKSGAGTHAS